MLGPESIVVWGAGAMGGSVGGWLARQGHDVVFVDSDADHVEAIRSRGLRITGPVDEFAVHGPCLLPEEVDGVLRTVLLCVKAHHTAGALDDLAPLLHPQGFVVSVQNGLNERIIADRIGAERTVGCFVNFGADVVAAGCVMRGNRGACVVGELNGTVTPRLRRLHSLLRLFEPDAVITENIWGFLWGKLAYGSMLFGTALADASIASVLGSARHRAVLIGLAREAVAVARRCCEAMGKTIVHQGGPGAGQHTKMVNQILIATIMIGVCEALLYGHRAGLDLETVLITADMEGDIASVEVVGNFGSEDGAKGLQQTIEEGIKSLDLVPPGQGAKDGGKSKLWEAIGMNSPDGEKVRFIRGGDYSPCENLAKTLSVCVCLLRNPPHHTPC